MEKICRSVTTLYRLPKISQLNFIAQVSTNNIHANSNYWNQLTVRRYSSQKPPSNPGLAGARIYGAKSDDQKGSDEQPKSIVEILDREIQDESTQLSQGLTTDQFPGFSVETDEADVKLTKQVKNATVTVLFSVSSSLNEWPTEAPEQSEQDEGMVGFQTSLLSMPEFQVQITKGKQTLELSCFYDEMDEDEETGEPIPIEPAFSVNELVIYEETPKETIFSVSAEYFDEDLQESLMDYLAKYGIDQEFGRNLVNFATSYEKKQYVGLMKRLKSFVTE